MNELTEAQFEALEAAIDALAASPHTERICNTFTTLINGRTFFEGCQCGRDAKVDEARGVLDKFHTT